MSLAILGCAAPGQILASKRQHLIEGFWPLLRSWIKFT
jgi:hypothetical protein